MRHVDESEPLTEEKWEAIIGNDESYDFKFFLCGEIYRNILQAFL